MTDKCRGGMCFHKTTVKTLDLAGLFNILNNFTFKFKMRTSELLTTNTVHAIDR